MGHNDSIEFSCSSFNGPADTRDDSGYSRRGSFSAELTAATSDDQRVQPSLKQWLAAAYERYANARQQVERYEKDILPDAQSSLDLMNTGYKAGEFGYLLLLTTQRTYFQTNLAYLDTLLQLRESTVEIEGLLLPGSSQQGE